MTASSPTARAFETEPEPAVQCLEFWHPNRTSIRARAPSFPLSQCFRSQPPRWRRHEGCFAFFGMPQAAAQCLRELAADLADAIERCETTALLCSLHAH